MENSESCSARLALPSAGLGFTAPTLARTRTEATKGRESRLQLRRQPDRSRVQPDRVQPVPTPADRDRAGQVRTDRVLAHLAPAHPVLAHPGQPQANPALRPDQNLPANVAPRHNTAHNHNTT